MMQKFKKNGVPRTEQKLPIFGCQDNCIKTDIVIVVDSQILQSQNF